MASRQQNRGPHPADTQLFSEACLSRLQQATEHLSWLLTRGYAMPSSVKLVGDRFGLVSRQRTAVMRAACSDQSLRLRNKHAVDPDNLLGAEIEIDALNLLITIEAALASGVVLFSRDGTYRDMASIHGSYRKVSQTEVAIELVGAYLSRFALRGVLWRIDRPVSNSGRLRALLTGYAARKNLAWEVRLDDDPDRVLGSEHATVVTADSAVLDRVSCWANLARWIVDDAAADAWIVAMTG